MSKRVVYNFKCACSEKKIFPMGFEIEDQSVENAITTNVVIDCPHCPNKQINATIEGKLVPDQEMMRNLDFNKEE